MPFFTLTSIHFLATFANFFNKFLRLYICISYFGKSFITILYRNLDKQLTKFNDLVKKDDIYRIPSYKALRWLIVLVFLIIPALGTLLCRWYLAISNNMYLQLRTQWKNNIHGSYMRKYGMFFKPNRIIFGQCFDEIGRCAQCSLV